MGFELAIESRLRSALTPSFLQIVDESHHHAGHAGANASGKGSHFRVTIAAPAFAGLSLLAQHRLVNAAVADLFAQGLHALAIEIRSPGQTASGAPKTGASVS